MVREYGAPPVVEREILRYAGMRGESPEVRELMESCLCEAENVFSYKICFAEVSLDSEICRVGSRDLAKALQGCESAIVFAATVGIGIDRLISRYSLLSPARSLMFQAIGSERVESLCDEFCRELAGEWGTVRPRFSPGYGDLPLSLQREIFALLDCGRSIGVALGENLLMSPSKSVTAIVGVKK